MAILVKLHAFRVQRLLQVCHNLPVSSELPQSCAGSLRVCAAPPRVFSSPPPIKQDAQLQSGDNCLNTSPTSHTTTRSIFLYESVLTDKNGTIHPIQAEQQVAPCR